MAHKGESFFTSIGCMDGRVQKPVARLGRKLTRAKYPDTVTEAGIVGQLAQEQVDPLLEASLQQKVVGVSVGKHHSRGIIVSGHPECAGHPVDDQQHVRDVILATTRVREMVGEEPPVYGAFVRRRRVLPGWKAEVINPQPIRRN
jgi:Putative carbonic anhydrase